MNLTDTQLNYFVSKVLHLGQGKKKEYLDQVDTLIEKLRSKLHGETDFKVKDFRKTGSIMKGTVLKPKGDRDVDADVAVYLDVSEADKKDVEKLHQIIIDLLVAAYPTKTKDDFKVQPRTVGVHFRTSGLDVDLVPVVPIAGEPGYAWQLSSAYAEPVKTNIKGQLDFIRSRKKSDRYFKATVRMLKYWRHESELKKLKSFTIELIVCYLNDKLGQAKSLEEAVVRFLLFVAQKELKEKIAFPENGKNPQFPNDPVVVLDPVNTENNVTMRLTDAERNEIVNEAKRSWEMLSFAQVTHTKGDTIERWKAVFGRSFVIEE